VGIRLGKGETLDDIMGSMSAVAEGVLTSRSACHLAKKMGVECPIIAGIYKVIFAGSVVSLIMLQEIENTVYSCPKITGHS